MGARVCGGLVESDSANCAGGCGAKFYTELNRAGVAGGVNRRDSSCFEKMVTVDGAAVTVMLSDLSAVRAGLLASVTRAVKLKVPVVVGVPVMAPLLAFSVKAGEPGGRGRDPGASDQV